MIFLTLVRFFRDVFVEARELQRKMPRHYRE